jgi:hypothetical protein
VKEYRSIQVTSICQTQIRQIWQRSARAVFERHNPHTFCNFGPEMFQLTKEYKSIEWTNDCRSVEERETGGLRGQPELTIDNRTKQPSRQVEFLANICGFGRSEYL